MEKLINCCLVKIVSLFLHASPHVGAGFLAMKKEWVKCVCLNLARVIIISSIARSIYDDIYDSNLLHPLFPLNVSGHATAGRHIKMYTNSGEFSIVDWNEK